VNIDGWPNRELRVEQSSGALKVATSRQIQSSVLRIEFDHNLRSRVVALFGGKPRVLAPFSASETIAGVRRWSNFTLSANRRERVSDSFGSGERLSLTGKSGDLRKDVSVTIYSDFPSMAIFDVTYTNEGVFL
jgi:alpha-galactosidase